MQSHRAFSITFQGLDFSPSFGFHSFKKATIVYHLNQSITLIDQIIFQNLYC